MRSLAKRVAVGFDLAHEWCRLIAEPRARREQTAAVDELPYVPPPERPEPSEAEQVRRAVSVLARDTLGIFVGLGVTLGGLVVAFHMILNPGTDDLSLNVRASWEALRHLRGDVRTEAILELSFVVFVPAFLVFVVDETGIVHASKSIRGQARREHVDRIFSIALTVVAASAMLHAVPDQRSVDPTNVLTGMFVAAVCCALLPLYWPSPALRRDVVDSLRQDQVKFLSAQRLLHDELDSAPELARMAALSDARRMTMMGCVHLTVGLVTGLVFTFATVMGGVWSWALCGCLVLVGAFLGGSKIKRSLIRRREGLGFPRARIDAWALNVLAWFTWAVVALVGLILMTAQAYVVLASCAAAVIVGSCFSKWITGQNLAVLVELVHVESELGGISRRLVRLDQES